VSRLPAVLAALLAALAIALVACGDDDSSSDSSSTESAAETDESARRVVIEAEEGAFNAQQIYESVSPGVVTVISSFGGGGSTPDLFGGGGGAGQGSGFVISDEGEIVTNAHVVTDAQAAGVQSEDLNEARQVYIQFGDGNQVEAEILGFDPYADVALLKVDPEGLDLKPIRLGSENDVDVGDGVAAIGSPFGAQQSQSLSVGVVSAADRSIESLTQFRIEGAIQTDASINPGNSGGPLLDAAGEVVGINQQIQTSSGGNEGVGFAVPIDLAERSIDQLREDGDVDYAYVGVETRELYPQLAEELGLDVETGALVAEVVPGGPADQAGLEAGNDPLRFQGFDYRVGGDVITAIEGEPILAGSDLPRLVALMDPGETINLDIIRDGEEREIEIELGNREDATG
jgi:S1-C subfamily serine protease